MSPSAQGRSLEQRGRTAARKSGLTLAATYAVVAILWIVLTDKAIAALGLPVSVVTFLSEIKGTAFVLVTAVLLYFLAARHLKQIYASEYRYRLLFGNAAEGVSLYHVERDQAERPTDIILDDANPAQLATWRTTRDQVVGRRRSTGGDDELPAYFDLVERAIAGGGEARDSLHFSETDTYALAMAYQVDDDLWAVDSMDITGVRRAQRALRLQEEQIRQAYVDVLDAVTGGKLLLMTEQEIERSLGEPLTPIEPVRSPAQLGEVRRRVDRAACERFPGLEGDFAIQNSVGEALNNALKHAGGGTYRVFAKDGSIQVLVRDHGPGIDFRSLPKATLVPGYSTAATLGMGFTIMMQLADRLLLSTRPGSTMLVIEISTVSRTGTGDSGEVGGTAFLGSELDGDAKSEAPELAQ